MKLKIGPILKPEDSDVVSSGEERWKYSPLEKECSSQVRLSTGKLNAGDLGNR